ncbi:MAG: VanZ family protein [Nakamurella sp.]
MLAGPTLLTLREQRLSGRSLPTWVRRSAFGLLAVTVVIAGVIVLSPGPPAIAGQTALRHWSAVWRIGGIAPAFLTFDAVEWLANVVMFFPIGFLFAAAVPPRQRHLVVPIAAAGSICVETAQLFIPERVSSVADVAANSLGALLGVLLLVACTARFART